MMDVVPTTLRARLEQGLGWLIKEAEFVWDDLPKNERVRRMFEFQLLRDCLVHVTGEPDPVIPSPWTEDEVFDSMRDYQYGI